MQTEQINIIERVKKIFSLKLIEICFEPSIYLLIDCSIVPLNSLVVYRTPHNDWTSFFNLWCCYIPADANILSPMTSANTDWAAILMHCFLKQWKYSCCSIIPGEATKHDQSTKAINTMMYHKTPSDHFVITIYVPQVIRTRHKISTLIYGWSLSHGSRRLSLMNCTSYARWTAIPRATKWLCTIISPAFGWLLLIEVTICWTHLLW